MALVQSVRRLPRTWRRRCMRRPGKRPLHSSAAGSGSGSKSRCRRPPTPPASPSFPAEGRGQSPQPAL
eukprot:3169740-Lingulodinium_polyedra.AAC.1